MAAENGHIIVVSAHFVWRTAVIEAAVELELGKVVPGSVLVKHAESQLLPTQAAVVSLLGILQWVLAGGVLKMVV